MIKKIIIMTFIAFLAFSPLIEVESYAKGNNDSDIVIDNDATPDIKIDNKTGKIALDSTITSKEMAFKKVLDNYKGLITFFGGLATITFVAIFIKHFVELGAKATNPNERKEIVSGLLWSGIAAACMGSVTFIFALLFDVFK